MYVYVHNTYIYNMYVLIQTDPHLASEVEDCTSETEIVRERGT